MALSYARGACRRVRFPGFADEFDPPSCAVRSGRDFRSPPLACVDAICAIDSPL